MTVPKGLKIADSFKGMGGQLGEGLASAFISIGYKRQVWSLKMGGEAPKLFLHDVQGTPSPLPYLDCVILKENPRTSKVYFGGVYSEDSTSPPLCQSVDGIRPDPGVPDRQNPTCHNCKHNQWGSAGNGSRGMACQNHRRLAVLLMPYMTEGMLAKPLEEPVFFKVPPNSLKIYKKYGEELRDENIPPYAVITRVTWNSSKQAEMKFEVKGVLTDKEQPRIKELLESSQVKQITGTAAEIREILPEIEEPKQIQAKTIELDAEEEEAPPAKADNVTALEKTVLEKDAAIDEGVALAMQRKMKNLL